MKFHQRFEWVYVLGAILLAILAASFFFLNRSSFNTIEYHRDSFWIKLLFSGVVLALVYKDVGTKSWSLAAGRVNFLAAISILSCVIYLLLNAIDTDISRAGWFFFLGQNFLTAVMEEGLFRVYVFFQLIRFFQNKKKTFWRSVFFCSMIFSLFHLIIIFRLGFDLSSTISFLIVAFSLGVLLQVVFISTKSILWPIALHFAYNAFVHFSAFSSTLSDPATEAVKTLPPSTLQSILSIAFFTVIGGIIILFARFVHNAREEENLRFIKQVQLSGLRS